MGLHIILECIMLQYTLTADDFVDSLLILLGEDVPKSPTYYKTLVVHIVGLIVSVGVEASLFMSPPHKDHSVPAENPGEP